MRFRFLISFSVFARAVALPGGYTPRHSSVDDQPGSLQGSIGAGYDPNLNNSVFEDSGSMQGGVAYGAPRAIFDEDEAQNEPPPLMKKTSRSTLGSDSRGLCSVGVIIFLTYTPWASFCHPFMIYNHSPFFLVKF